MPLYDFKCPKCGTLIDAIQSYSAPAPKCPNCGTEMTKEVSKPAGFEFKGSGFYATDFKKKH